MALRKLFPASLALFIFFMPLVSEATNIFNYDEIGDTRIGWNITQIVLVHYDESEDTLECFFVSGVARKLAVLLHRLWAGDEPYDPFYNSRRSGDACPQQAA